MIDRTAAGDPADHGDVARRHDVGVDLLDRVLVAADDDRARIDVEEQHVLVRRFVSEDVLLEREVEPGVGDAEVVDEEHG